MQFSYLEQIVTALSAENTVCNTSQLAEVSASLLQILKVQVLID